MRKSLIIIAAAILIICLPACQVLAIEKGMIDAADREVLRANASNIATAFNAYNAIYPDNMLPDDVTLEKAKEILKGEDLWPRSLDDETALKAWEFIVIKGGEAKVIGED